MLQNAKPLCSHRVTGQRRGGVSRNTLTANPKFRDLTPPPHSGLNVCVFEQKTPIQDSIARAAWGRSRITKKWICRERVRIRGQSLCPAESLYVYPIARECRYGITVLYRYSTNVDGTVRSTMFNVHTIRYHYRYDVEPTGTIPVQYITFCM